MGRRTDVPCGRQTDEVIIVETSNGRPLDVEWTSLKNEVHLDVEWTSPGRRMDQNGTLNGRRMDVVWTKKGR